MRHPLQVAGAATGCGIAHGHPHIGPRVVHGQLQPLDMDGELQSASAQLLGSAAHSLAHQPSQLTALLGDLAHQSHGSFGISPGRPARDQSPFLCLHSESHRAADADSIQAVTVAHLVELGDSFDVVYQAHGTEGGNSLIFRPCSLYAGIRPLDHGHFSATSDRTTAASIGPRQDRLRHAVAGDFLRALRPAPQAPVLQGKIAEPLKGDDAAGSADIMEPLCVLSDFGQQLAHRLAQAGLIMDGRPRRSFSDDGLELLGAHDRAQARASRRAACTPPAHHRRVR